jgi:hypothetical protein
MHAAQTVPWRPAAVHAALPARGAACSTSKSPVRYSIGGCATSAAKAAAARGNGKKGGALPQLPGSPCLICERRTECKWQFESRI